MPTVSEVTDPLLWTYQTVPPPRDGVCRTCHGASGGFPKCWSCKTVMSQVSHPCPLVVPISLTHENNQHYDSLKRYKAQWLSSTARSNAELAVAALLNRFLRQHRTCIAAAAGEDWDLITIVPSTRHPEGPHPMVGVIQRSPWLEDQFRLVLGSGSDKLGFNNASDKGFGVTEDVKGRSILILDDTYTTGARSQSAASALTQAGARVVAIVPAGRFIRPRSDHPENGALIEEAKLLSFSFDYCCVGRHPLPPPRAEGTG